MEKLIILLLFGLGSAVLNWYQQKQKKEEEKREMDRLAREGTARPHVALPPLPSRPESPAQWAEELRRFLDPNAPRTTATNIPTVATVRPLSRPQPPPVIVRSAPPPVQVPPEISEGDLIVTSPLTQSAIAYDRAASLQGKVEARMKTIDEQTEKHTKRSIIVRRKTRPARELVQSWKDNPQTLREAFLASIIFERQNF